MGKIVVEGLIVSTHPMDAYGGVRLAEEAVHSAGEQLRSGSVRFGLHHDPRLALEYRLVEVSERRGDDGHLAVFASFEVDEDEWVRMGGPGLGGFSISTWQSAFGDKNTARLSVAADAYWFDKSALQSSYEELSRLSGSVAVSELFQFSVEPDSVIFVNLLLNQVPPFVLGLAVNWVYDGLTHFFAGEPRSKSSRLHFKITDEISGRTVEAHIVTNSARTLRKALDSLPAAVENASRADYDEETDSWL